MIKWTLPSNDSWRTSSLIMSLNFDHLNWFVDWQNCIGVQIIDFISFPLVVVGNVLLKVKLLGRIFVAIRYLCISESIQLDIFTEIECNVSPKELVTSLQRPPGVVLFRFSFVYWTDWGLLAIRSKEKHICKTLLLEAGTINLTVTLQTWNHVTVQTYFYGAS